MEEELSKAIQVLKKGGIILYPTDTLWGIGCDATNSKAIKKIYKLKKRADSKSFIILLDKIDKLKNYVEDIPEITHDLINSIERPLTIIYPGARNLSKDLIPANKTIAIRIVKNSEFCMRLLQTLNKPLVSTSANISGEADPLFFSEISELIINGVDYVVNLNQDKISEVRPSTIIKFNSNNEFKVIRE